MTHMGKFPRHRGNGCPLGNCECNVLRHPYDGGSYRVARRPRPGGKTSMAEWEPCLSPGVRGTAEPASDAPDHRLGTHGHLSVGSRSSRGTPQGACLRWRSYEFFPLCLYSAGPRQWGWPSMVEWEPRPTPCARGQAIRSRPLWETGAVPATPWLGRRPPRPRTTLRCGGPPGRVPARTRVSSSDRLTKRANPSA